MKFKHLFVLSGILLVLAASLFFKDSKKTLRPAEETLIDIVESKLTLEELDECIFSFKAGDNEVRGIHLERRGENWFSKEHRGAPAPQEVLAKFIAKLDGLKGELRSEDPELFKSYGIEEHEAMHVLLRSEAGEILHLLVGRKKAGFKNNFVRVAKSPRVYVVEESLLADFGFWGEWEAEDFNEDQWVNRHLASFDPGSIASFEIFKDEAFGEEPLAHLLSREGDGKRQWRYDRQYDFVPDGEKINAYLESVNKTMAHEIIPRGEALISLKNAWHLILSFEDGRELTIRRGPWDASREGYLVDVSGLNYAFLLSKAQGDRLMRQDKDFADYD